MKKGKNINYYDDKDLLNAVTPFIIATLRQQLKWPVNKTRCLCIGGEKNFKFLQRINMEYSFFNKIVPLPHPRFIMQYRRRQKEKYISSYLSCLADSS